jgi:hypothetical protein
LGLIFHQLSSKTAAASLTLAAGFVITAFRPCASQSDSVTKPVMTDRFFISDGGEVRGPYAKDQLRSMWGAGQITAAALYRRDGSEDWKSIEELRLSQAFAVPAKVEAINVVETTGSGAGLVAAGSVMCIVGLLLAFVPNVGGFGGLLLLAGFVMAVVGRMRS